jgi:DNA primase
LKTRTSHIDQEEIRRLKELIPISVVISLTPLDSKYALNEYGKMCCPFHLDRTPSLQVYTETNTFFCFGCGLGGDVIAFTRLLFDESFVEAIDRLKNWEGEISVGPTLKTKTSLLQLSEQGGKEVFQFIESRLQREELDERKEFLRERSIRASSFYGFSWGIISPLSSTELSELTPTEGELLKKIGFLVETGHSLYQPFGGRLCFIVKDANGQGRAMIGRSLNGDPKWLLTRDTSFSRKSNLIFGLYESRFELEAKGTCVLVEGVFDVWALRSAGIMNVVSVLGTKISPQQVELLGKSVSHVFIWFDGDSAGRLGAEAVKRNLESAGLEVEVCLTETDHDPEISLRGLTPLYQWDESQK